MTIQYQVTLICTTNQYKPVSCLVKREQADNIDLTKNKAERKKITDEGVKKICAGRYWSSADLKKNNYTRVKVRLYDKEKIEAEVRKRYEAIKEAKYASGEWQRPKTEQKKDN